VVTQVNDRSTLMGCNKVYYLLTKETNLFDLRPLPGKGVGLFARQHIKRGTRLIAETAIATCPLDSTDGLYAQIEALSTERRNAYISLALNIDHLDQRIIHDMMAKIRQSSTDAYAQHVARNDAVARQIYITNCTVTGQEGAHATSVFLTHSRMNHSCQPNACCHVNTQLDKLTVHATHDIAANEELCYGYIELLRLPEERAQALSRWGIVCDCAACVGPNAAESKLRRSRGAKIEGAMLSGLLNTVQTRSLNSCVVQMPKSDRERLELAEELVQICIAENLYDPTLAGA